MNIKLCMIGVLLAWTMPVSAGTVAPDAADASWPTFHGLRRDNLVRETGLLKSWSKEGPPMLWRFSQCGKGYSAVSVARQQLFLTGDFGDEESVMALDLRGQLVWKAANGKSWKGAQPGARTTPAYDDGMVYHLGPHGNLTAFKASDGGRVWSLDVRERFEAPLGLWGYTENLLVEGDTLFCMPGGVKGRVVALDKKTGRVLWANTQITDRCAYSSPILATHRGVRQLICLGRNTFFGVDSKSGDLLWTHPHESFCDQNVTSPIYDQGRVFVTSGHRAGGRAVELSADGRQARPLWFTTRFDNCHGGVVLIDGYLYGSGCRLYNKGLLCVELVTGRVMYQAKEIGKVSITWADGLLYCFGNDGEVLLVSANPQSASIISRFEIPRADKDNTLSHPVICGGRLYLRHHDQLLAYDVAGAGSPSGQLRVKAER